MVKAEGVEGHHVVMDGRPYRTSESIDVMDYYFLPYLNTEPADYDRDETSAGDNISQETAAHLPPWLVRIANTLSKSLRKESMGLKPEDIENDGGAGEVAQTKFERAVDKLADQLEEVGEKVRKLDLNDYIKIDMWPIKHAMAEYVIADPHESHIDSKFISNLQQGEKYRS